MKKEITFFLKLIFRMFRITKYFVLFGIFCLQSIYAQSSVEAQLAWADKLFASNQYFDAITEYRRALFFDDQSQYTDQVNFRIAKCYKAGAHFDEAIKYFALAEKGAAHDSILFEAELEIIRCNILRKTTERALQLCDELGKNEKFSSKKNEINYWRGWAFMFAGDWESASKFFSETPADKELKLLCNQVIDAKVSVTFATVISYILPGAGQIYSGKILSGLMSLAWNLAAGYFTVNAFVANRAFDGIVIGELIWLRFYRGSIENAKNFAVEKNIEVSNKALKYLQNEYRGLKP
ncbi:MAG: hypothetical protein Q8L04_11245 [Ignavibacteria bacterium]|nr:hypothetical protein [Ignavibacteria bacterium]